MSSHPQLWISLLLLGGTAQAAQAPSALARCYASSANRIAVGQCLHRKFAEVSAELADAVEAMRERMIGLDAAAGRQLATAAFDRSQQAFIGFRASNCAWRAAQVGAGTGSGDVERDCAIRMTQDRTQELMAEVQTVGSIAVPEPAPCDGPADLAGRAWRLTRLLPNGPPFARSPESMPCIEFGAAGRVRGNASVNCFSAGYAIDASGGLRWSETRFATTRMAGPPELMRQEAWFLDALRHAAHVRVAGDTLVLADDEQTVVLMFEH
jgi:heat shock protein HslJ